MATLYVVATPIGNLDDLSPRARVKRSRRRRAFSPRTRDARLLLSYAGIGGKTVVARRAAHARRRNRVERLAQGLEANESVALVTDAGAPRRVRSGRVAHVRSGRRARGARRADPGARRRGHGRRRGVGARRGPFLFLGFHARHQQRSDAPSSSASRTSPEPVILFEAPSRIADSLRELAVKTPERPVALCRELTPKLHEEESCAARWPSSPCCSSASGSARSRWCSAHDSTYPRSKKRPKSRRNRRRDHEPARKRRAPEGPRGRARAQRLGIPRRSAYARVSAVRGPQPTTRQRKARHRAAEPAKNGRG